MNIILLTRSLTGFAIGMLIPYLSQYVGELGAASWAVITMIAKVLPLSALVLATLSERKIINVAPTLEMLFASMNIASLVLFKMGVEPHLTISTFLVLNGLGGALTMTAYGMRWAVIVRRIPNAATPDFQSKISAASAISGVLGAALGMLNMNAITALILSNAVMFMAAWTAFMFNRKIDFGD